VGGARSSRLCDRATVRADDPVRGRRPTETGARRLGVAARSPDRRVASSAATSRSSTISEPAATRNASPIRLANAATVNCSSILQASLAVAGVVRTRPITPVQKTAAAVVACDSTASPNLTTIRRLVRRRQMPRNRITMLVLGRAEGEGFEPSSDPRAQNGFRDRAKNAICREFCCRSPVCSPCSMRFRRRN
jgi:hypothetical protein